MTSSSIMFACVWPWESRQAYQKRIILAYRRADVSYVFYGKRVQYEIPRTSYFILKFSSNFWSLNWHITVKGWRRARDIVRASLKIRAHTRPVLKMMCCNPRYFSVTKMLYSIQVFWWLFDRRAFISNYARRSVDNVFDFSRHQPLLFPPLGREDLKSHTFTLDSMQSQSTSFNCFHTLLLLCS